MGGFVGSLQMLSMGEALEDKSGDFRRSSRILSSLLSPSWSLRLLNVELLTSDRLNSSPRVGDGDSSLLQTFSVSVGDDGFSLSNNLTGDSGLLGELGIAALISSCSVLFRFLSWLADDTSVCMSSVSSTQISSLSSSSLWASSERDLSGDTNTDWPFCVITLFFSLLPAPVSLKPLAKGLWSIFSCVIFSF